MEFKAVIFDMDGVIVNTVPIHFKAWKKMFTEYGKNFTVEDYQRKVDGIPRTDGARAILTDFSDNRLKEATDKKQKYFLEFLKKDKIPVFKTTVIFIKELIENNIKTAVISSSKNCPYVLERAKLNKLFNVRISGNDITKGKPDPEIFLMATERLRLKPIDCIVVEDAVLGVEAAERAGMFCIGIDRHNTPEKLKKANVVIKDLSEINFTKLKGL
jgi:beta-phosphoglucomutase